jgi:hypothetical protein
MWIHADPDPKSWVHRWFYAQEAHKGGFRAHTVKGGGAGEQRNLITLLGLLRCIKELNHPAPPLLFSPSTFLILPLQLGPLDSPPPTPHPPPLIQNLLEINSKLLGA